MGDKEEKGDAVPKGEQEKETLAGEEEKKVNVFVDEILKHNVL